jgi:hypothetical protein
VILQDANLEDSQSSSVASTAVDPENPSFKPSAPGSCSSPVTLHDNDTNLEDSQSSYCASTAVDPESPSFKPSAPGSCSSPRKRKFDEHLDSGIRAAGQARGGAP